MKMQNRKSHENESVKTLYKEFFIEPNSHKAHEILHTEYFNRKGRTIHSTEDPLHKMSEELK